MRRWAATLAVAVAAAGAQPGHDLALKSGTLTYRVVHKLHQVQGTSRELEGRAIIQDDGTGRVQVRAKVASFDSGNANRDAHMREATHEPVHPYAEVKGTVSGVRLPLTAPLQLSMRATVELNGEKQPATIPISLRPEASNIHATFSFPISLESFKVERPELLFVKIDDRAEISGDLVFAESR
ncbi:MAG TPA: YceI family protein [Myxococcales bacterium]|jgi:polyisoprenoid-binding protein YceI|nr:YceI family protein [Myxococcales bacterium]